MTIEPYRFTLGTFECVVMNDARVTASPGELLHDMTDDALAAALKAEALPTGEQILDVNTLLVKAGEDIVLVDGGSGVGDLMQHLRAEGIASGDIDIVFLTHSDNDHIGGLLKRGRLVFKNARHVMWDMLWQMGAPDADPREYERDSLEAIQKTFRLLGSRAEAISLEQEFLPGFRAINGAGHRREHTALLITSGDAALIHVGDAVAHPLQVSQPSWVTKWDPPARGALVAETVATRRELLDRAARLDALLFGTHLPFPGLGRVVAEGDSWRWLPAEMQG